MITKSQEQNFKTCPICFENFTLTGATRPKMAPCGHSFCVGCVLKIGMNQGHQAKCPLCRYPYRLHIGQPTGDRAGADDITSFLCIICFEPYSSEGERRPKLLPCDHSFCLKCFKDFKVEEVKVTCVECQKEHVVPEGGVSCFPTNEFLCAVQGLVTFNQSEASIQPLSATAFSDAITVQLRREPESHCVQFPSVSQPNGEAWINSTGINNRNTRDSPTRQPLESLRNGWTKWKNCAFISVLFLVTSFAVIDGLGTPIIVGLIAWEIVYALLSALFILGYSFYHPCYLMKCWCTGNDDYITYKECLSLFGQAYWFGRRWEVDEYPNCISRIHVYCRRFAMACGAVCCVVFGVFLFKWIYLS